MNQNTLCLTLSNHRLSRRILKFTVFLAAFAFLPSAYSASNIADLPTGQFVCTIDYLKPDQIAKLPVDEAMKEMVRDSGYALDKDQIPVPETEWTDVTKNPQVLRRFHLSPEGVGFEIGIPDFFLPISTSVEPVQASDKYIAAWYLQRMNLFPVEGEVTFKKALAATFGSRFAYSMGFEFLPVSTQAPTLNSFDFIYDREITEQQNVYKKDQGHLRFEYDLELVSRAILSNPLVYYSTHEVTSYENMLTGETMNEPLTLEFHSRCVFVAR